MSLDERCTKIFTEILNNKNITGNQIENLLGITRKQLSYSIEKINAKLKDDGFAPIERLKTGQFVIPKEIIEYYRSNTIVDKNEYIFSEYERMIISTIILLQRNDDLSLNYLVSLLKVSKNTILNDFKKIQKELLDSYEIELSYNRQKGYYLSGREYHKRHLLVYVTKQILMMANGKEIIDEICNINKVLMSSIVKDLNEIETVNLIRFTDESIKELPYIIYFCILRYTKGKRLDKLSDDLHLVLDESERYLCEDFFAKYNIQDQNEINFLVSLLQISNVIVKGDSDIENNQLSSLVNEMVDNFEKMIMLEISDKAKLCEMLIQHIKPSIYRLKYGYKIDDSILKMVLPKHGVLHEIVKRSIAGIEEFFEISFSDEELAYITIIFGGWLTKDGELDKIETRRKAIVICTNGISISNFLYVTLKKIFPEFDFIDTMSVRLFNTSNVDCDLIFTTVKLDTSIPQYLVKPIMSEIALRNLRAEVFNDITGVTIQRLDYINIMSVIKKYCQILDEENLEREIRSLVNYHKPVEKKIDKSELEINDILSLDGIFIDDGNDDWQKILYRASKYLIDNGVIEESYYQSMVNEIIINNPIWNIAPGIVLAHSGIDKGVNSLGISVLKLNQTIMIEGYMQADIIIVLATPDHNAHLKVLYHLIDLTEDDEIINKLKNCQSEKAIYELLIKEKEIC